MIIKTKQNTEIINTSYQIGENTSIYYPEAKKGEELFTDPQDGEIEKYTPEDIPKNTFEGYYDEETQIAIIIFSIGHKLYIRPELSYLYPSFFLDTANKLKQMGLKPKKMNTPFSCGAIPASTEWIFNYRNAKATAEEFCDSFKAEFDEDFGEEGI